ncbi:MAG: PSD1 and planctomycete cytochrome C domain-containing protein [Planctomycetaceae bacterium]
MPYRHALRALGPALIVALWAPIAPAADQAAALDYTRDIRPILSDKCFRCHGPDEAARESGLRLDLRDAALLPADSGSRAIVPGKPEASRLVERIESTDSGEVMPPPETNKKLSAAEKEQLKRWIAQGAPYQQHWSFVVPRRPEVPNVNDTRWPRNDLDRFILRRLETERLRPGPEADRVTLIRRLTLDLTGLPPTPAEVDAYLADASEHAYENVVDRLLANPHYGERMAVDWLDAARFADTHGYHIDSGRDMSRWREWVIEAFNRNLPFDQFTIEQVAGDLLPNATNSQKIASGFHRNHMINFEGGAIPEEYHAQYIVDRVNTTGMVWLGLTIGCAQCHDHKYDPITQQEYYRLYAFFHNVPEKGLDGIKGNAAPLLKAPTAEQQTQLDRLRANLAQHEEQLTAPHEAADRAQEIWERAFALSSSATWLAVTGKAGPAARLTAAGGATFEPLDDASILVVGENPQNDTYTIEFDVERPTITGIRLNALPDDRLPGRGPGRSENGNFILTDVRVAYAPVGANGVPAEPVAVRIHTASCDFNQPDYPITLAIDDDPVSGWAIFPAVSKEHFAVFELERPIQSDEPRVRVGVTLQFQSNWPRHQLGRFRLSHTSALQMHPLDTLPKDVREILTAEGGRRSEADGEALRRYYRLIVSPFFRSAGDELKKLQQEQARVEESIPTTMVMQELQTPRDTFVLVRGEYDKKGNQVTAGVPAALPALPEGAPLNRLGLAQWLVAPSNPLTPRVAVNRYWQMFFGTGLVKSSEDFGSQGELPSHPELLDWLAAEFSAPATSAAERPATGWDVQRLVRLFVTSAAYRQSSAVSRELHARDPENRLLARGPRFRLQAEFIRDQALAASGLLNARIGGPSVSPYQPAGLWEELMSREDGKRFTAQTYEQSHGADLYRRTMYTFWKRSCPPPTLATFDAPDRETCTIRRARTNTPLQALVLLNDPTYVEAARALAERALTQGGATTDARIAFAFRLVTARRPTAPESSILKELLEAQLAKYRDNGAAAAKLLSVGESPRNPAFDAAELAAWTTLASAILNLDETVSRG